jgi:hypothetical protein
MCTRLLIGVVVSMILRTWSCLGSESAFPRPGKEPISFILFHASADVGSEFVPVTRVQFVLVAAIAIAVAVGDRMWRKLAAGSRAVRDAAHRAGLSDEGGIRHAIV